MGKNNKCLYFRKNNKQKINKSQQQQIKSKNKYTYKNSHTIIVYKDIIQRVYTIKIRSKQESKLFKHRNNMQMTEQKQELNDKMNDLLIYNKFYNKTKQDMSKRKVRTQELSSTRQYMKQRNFYAINQKSHLNQEQIKIQANKKVNINFNHKLGLQEKQMLQQLQSNYNPLKIRRHPQSDDPQIKYYFQCFNDLEALQNIPYYLQQNTQQKKCPETLKAVNYIKHIIYDIPQRKLSQETITQKDLYNVDDLILQDQGWPYKSIQPSSSGINSLVHPFEQSKADQLQIIQYENQ